MCIPRIAGAIHAFELLHHEDARQDSALFCAAATMAPFYRQDATVSFLEQSFPLPHMLRRTIGNDHRGLLYL